MSSNATPDAASRPAPGSSASPFKSSSGQSVFLGVGFDQRQARRRALLVLLGGLLLTAAVVTGVVWRQVQTQNRRAELAAIRHATLFHDKVRGAAAAVMTAVTWVLQANGDVGYFQHYATVLLPAYPGLLALDLAPDAVVRSVAPAGRLSGLLGRNLLHEPATKAVASGAIRTRNLWFGSPMEVGTNTVAIPVRAPVFFPEAAGNQRLWGLVGGYVDLAAVQEGARLSRLADQGYGYSLEVVPAAGEPLRHLAGALHPPRDAERQEVHFSDVAWRLAVWPLRPAGAFWRVALLCLPGVAISLLAAALVGALGRSRQAAAAALQALAEKNRAGQRYGLLLEGVPDPLILTKPDGRVVSLNQAAEEAFGYARGELLGRPLTTLLPVAEGEADDAQTRFALPEAGPATARHKDGREIPVIVRTGRMEGAANGGALLCHTLRRTEPAPVPAEPPEAPRATEPEPPLAPEPPPAVEPAQRTDLGVDPAILDELETLKLRWTAVTAGLRDWESWLDLEGRSRWIGGPVESFTGYSAEELLAQEYYPLPLAVEEDRDALREVWLNAMQGASGSNFEFRVRRRDGQIRRVVMSWRPVSDEHHRALGFRTTIRPAAQAVPVQATEPVEPAPAPADDKSETTLEQAIESAGIGVWDWDLTTGRNTWDERMLGLFGLSPEEFGQCSDPWRRRLHPDDLERFEAAVDSARSGEGEFDLEGRVQMPDGSQRFLACKGRLQRDAEGRPERLVGAAWDTSALRQVEEELLRDHTLLQDLLAGTWALVHVKDSTGRYLLANPAWCEHFEVPAEQVPGAEDAALLPEETAAQLGEADRRVASTLAAEQRIEELPGRGGTGRFLVERFPLLDGGERLAAAVSIAVPLPESVTSPQGGREPSTAAAESGDEAEDSAADGDPDDAAPPPEAPPPEPAPEPKPRRKKAIRKKRPRVAKAPADMPQTMLPGFGQSIPDPASAPPARLVDPGAVAEQLGVSSEEVGARLADFAVARQRDLRELREALEEEDLPEARELSHAIAEAAGAHGIETLRRLAKTIELAIRYGEGNLPSMLAELEAGAERVFAEIDE